VQLRGTIFRKQDTITTKSTTATLTAAELLTKIINYTGSGHTLTLPTATDTIAGMPSGIANQTSFDFSVINTGSGSATLATNTGVTSVGSLVVAAGASGSFRMRKTTASTCTIYRMS
jgi:hypothetical protein